MDSYLFFTVWSLTEETPIQNRRNTNSVGSPSKRTILNFLSSKSFSFYNEKHNILGYDHLKCSHVVLELLHGLDTPPLNELNTKLTGRLIPVPPVSYGFPTVLPVKVLNIDVA